MSSMLKHGYTGPHRHAHGHICTHMHICLVDGVLRGIHDCKPKSQVHHELAMWFGELFLHLTSLCISLTLHSLELPLDLETIAASGIGFSYFPVSLKLLLWFLQCCCCSLSFLILLSFWDFLQKYRLPPRLGPQLSTVLSWAFYLTPPRIWSHHSVIPLECLERPSITVTNARWVPGHVRPVYLHLHLHWP